MYYSDMQGKRLDYIDAMRGVAILFVVFGHIPMYCYGIANEHLSSFRALTSLLQMPMLFFVSGFVLNPQKNVNGGRVFQSSDNLLFLRCYLAEYMFS